MAAIRSRIFISYRRADTGQAVPSLSAALKKAFGPDAVFVDTAAIRVGSQWPQDIDQALKAADILLVALGPEWLSAGGKHRRLDQEADWVRNEIAKSIKRKIPVIPLLIGGAAMPKVDALPACLAKLPNYQNFELRNDHWENDVAALIAELVRIGCKALPVGAPKIILMDSYAKVYERKPVAGEMNSHVIRRCLQGLLPVEAMVIEPVDRDWQGGDAISKRKPDLIIMHYSCLQSERHLKQFLEKILLTSETTKIIVYSRTTASPTMKAASAFARMIQKLVPGVKDRVFGLPLYRRKLRRQTFSDPETASALRALASNVLAMDGWIHMGSA